MAEYTDLIHTLAPIDAQLTDEEIIAEIHKYVTLSREYPEYFPQDYCLNGEYGVLQMARLLEISPHTVRFYDKEHLFPFVVRTKSGRRAFTAADVAIGKLTKCLRALGLPLPLCRQFILWTFQGDATSPKRLSTLKNLYQSLNEQIVALQKAQTELLYKIRFFDIVASEAEGAPAARDLRRGTLPELHKYITRQKEISFMIEENGSQF